jgi:hypothetical protein
VKFVMDLRVYVGFEVFTAVTMKNGVFCDVTPCGFNLSVPKNAWTTVVVLNFE